MIYSGEHTELNYNKDIDEQLKIYLPMVQLISSQFGNSCEAILYDFRDFKSSVVAISGNVTEQYLGAKLPRYIQDIIKKEGNKAQDRFGFINKTIHGYVLRSSIMFIRKQEEVIGCLCMNYNIMHFKMIISFLEEFCRSNQPEDDELIKVKTKGQETIDEKAYSAHNVQEFLENILDEYVKEKTRNKNMKILEKEDKIEMIRELDEKGVFLVKGAVNSIAKHLQMSKFTVYNYLNEIRTDVFEDNEE